MIFISLAVIWKISKIFTSYKLQVFFYSIRQIMENLIEHSNNYVIENFLQSNKIEWKKTQ